MPLSKKRDKERKQVSNLNTEGFQPNSNLSLHPIVLALSDPMKREKLRRICDSLKSHGVLDKVQYGIRPMGLGKDNFPTMEKVSLLLEAL